jgi:hypothetical protein
VGFLFGGRRLANLVTCIVERDRSQWRATWASDGKVPADLSGPSLREVIEQGSAQVASLYKGKAEAADAELQIAIYPWEGKAGGVILDVTGGPNGLDVRDIQGSGIAFHSQSIESLVDDAARYVPNPGDAMLRWIRRVSDL